MQSSASGRDSRLSPIRARKGPRWNSQVQFLPAPEAYVATMSKAKRTGKIFLDYFRNGYTATSIADYGGRGGRPEMPDNNTRHTSSVALVLIDVVNHFEFPGGDRLLRQALPVAARLARLKQRCRGAGIPA